MEETQILKEIGLTNNEIEIYIALLKSGPVTASQITEKTRIHRMNVYSLLERLQEKGLISFALSGKRRYYEAANPKILLSIEEERKNRIVQLIPKLCSEMNISSNTQEALIYKEKKGIRAALDEVTKSKTEVCIFASGWGFQKHFPDYYEIWHDRLVQNKIKGRMLLSNKFRGLNILKPWVYRFLPSDFAFPSTTLVFDDKVFLNIWGTPPLGILIRGKEVSESYKQYFELLWKIAKK